MKPAYLFQILDLPIVDSFLYKHGETLNKVLFKKDIALYKEINVDQPLIEDTFRNVKDSAEDIKRLFQDGKVIKKLIGVDIYEFLDLTKIKVKEDKVLYGKVEAMIDDFIKLRTMIENLA